MKREVKMLQKNPPTLEAIEINELVRDYDAYLNYVSECQDSWMKDHSDFKLLRWCLSFLDRYCWRN